VDWPFGIKPRESKLRYTSFFPHQGVRFFLLPQKARDIERFLPSLFAFSTFGSIEPVDSLAVCFFSLNPIHHSLRGEKSMMRSLSFFLFPEVAVKPRISDMRLVSFYVDPHLFFPFSSGVKGQYQVITQTYSFPFFSFSCGFGQ